MGNKNNTKAELLEEIKDLEKEVQSLEEEQGECPNCDGEGDFGDCPNCDELRSEVRSLEDDVEEKDDEIQDLENKIYDLENEQVDTEELAAVSSDLADLQYKIDAMI